MTTGAKLMAMAADCLTTFRDRPRWRREILNAVLDHGSHFTRKGPAPGSDNSSEGLDYRVLTTDGVREHLSWLHDWYTGPGLDLARQFDPTARCTTGLAAVNVNLLVGEGDTYEWHTDSYSHTMVLFASTVATEHGGALEIKLDEPHGTVAYQPEAGTCVIFNSGKLFHRVAPLVGDVVRVSCVMEYPIPGQPERDPELNRQLFGRDR